MGGVLGPQAWPVAIAAAGEVERLQAAEAEASDRVVGLEAERAARQREPARVARTGFAEIGDVDPAI